MNMDKLTLVQKAVNLDEYQDMLLKKQLPLVVRLTKEEVKNQEFGANPFSELYYQTFDSDGFENQFLHEDRLREAIEEKKIFIPELIDTNGDTKYVDYISESHSVDFGGRIVFRNTKRLFKGGQAKYSIQKNHAPVHSEIVPMRIGNTSGMISIFSYPGHSKNSEELFYLCSETLYHSKSKMEDSSTQKRIQIS